jgi:release factor glutamine methyltransferase
MTIKDILEIKDLDYFDLRLLIQHVLKFSKVDIILKNDYELNFQEQTLINNGIFRLREKEPISYIIGYKEFYSYKFKVNHHTLIPRPETELLVDLVLQKTKSNSQILDLGTGSGCIAISIYLQFPEFKVTAVDKYQDALNVAIYNNKMLGANVDFLQSNWYSSLSNKKFDIIVSNPPYIVKGDPHLTLLKYEPNYALTDGANGLTHIIKIVEGAKEHLNNNGVLMIEHGYNQVALVQEIFQQNFFTSIRSICDLSGIERVTLGVLNSKL